MKNIFLAFGLLAASVAQAVTLNTQTTTLPTETTPATVVATAPQKTFRSGFDAAVASGPDTSFFTAIQTGSGMGVSQSGGNLLITTGTTTYSETILRSVQSWAANTTIRYSTNISQRIVNQEFYVELCDVIGDGLAYTINSTTSVTVTIPGTTFTSANVGQSMYLGAMTVASCPTGRYTIASVSGTAVTFTVAAFPASGSGTLSLFGWNYYHCLYSGTTATNAGYDCQRNGWNSGDTTITINTTASPGHTVTMAQRNATANIFDELSASSTAIENTIRASRVRNIPEDLTTMRVQFRAVNLSTAPASTTTWTIGVIEVDNFVPQQVTLVSVEPQGLNWPLPVQVFNTPSDNIAQYGGTAVVNGGVPGVPSAGGNVAVSAARTANPLPVGGVDTSGLTRVNLLDVVGTQNTYGSGESVTTFSVGTGAAAVTDGTNGKTIFLQPKNADFYVGFSAISTTPTVQLEISYDNVLFAVVPLSRVDTTAASQQYNGVAAFTPVLASMWRGKTYGAPILRVHLTAGTTSNTVGQVRVVYNPEAPGTLVSPFAFTATNTTEAVGVANGQIFTGGVRTVQVPVKGSAVAQLEIDADTGTNTVALEGSQDLGTTWNALAMQPIAGGATVTSFSSTGTAALPQTGTWQADVSGMTNVRAHCTAYTGGNPFGAIKIITVPTSTVGPSRKATYTASVSGAVTATTNVLSITSGAAKTTIIKRIIVNGGTATAIVNGSLTVIRGTVAAPAGGTAVTASTMQHNPADAAFSGAVLQGIASAITTTGLTSTSSAVVIPTPVETATLGIPNNIVYDFTNGGSIEGFQIPVAATNSVLFSFTGTTGGGNFALTVDFTEE